MSATGHSLMWVAPSAANLPPLTNPANAQDHGIQQEHRVLTRSLQIIGTARHEERAVAGQMWRQPSLALAPKDDYHHRNGAATTSTKAASTIRLRAICRTLAIGSISSLARHLVESSRSPTRVATPAVRHKKEVLGRGLAYSDACQLSVNRISSNDSSSDKWCARQLHGGRGRHDRDPGRSPART